MMCCLKSSIFGTRPPSQSRQKLSILALAENRPEPVGCDGDAARLVGKDDLKDVMKEVEHKDALKGSSPSALLIPGLHYRMCNGKLFGLCARSPAQVAETPDS